MTDWSFTNFADAEITADITSGATTLYVSVSDAALYPNVTGGALFSAVLWDGTNAPEIVHRLHPRDRKPKRSMSPMK